MVIALILHCFEETQSVFSSSRGHRLRLYRFDRDLKWSRGCVAYDQHRLTTCGRYDMEIALSRTGSTRAAALPPVIVHDPWANEVE